MQKPNISWVNCASYDGFSNKILIAGVDRELPEQDDRNRLREVAADAGGNAPSFDGACGEAVEPGDAVAVSGDMGPRATPGFVQPRFAVQPAVEGGNAGGEARDVGVRSERRRGVQRSHRGFRAKRAFTAGSGSTGASRAAVKASQASSSRAMMGRALKGGRAGQHSVRINDQWRICFVWTEQGPADVEIVDYH